MESLSGVLSDLSAHVAHVTDGKHELLAEMGVLCLGWFVLYGAFRHVVFPRFSAEFSNRWVSFVHAIIAFVLSVRAIDLRTWTQTVGEPTTEAQAQVLGFSLAYFLYDFICCLFISVDIGNIFHHVVTIIGLYVGVFEGFSGTELTVCLAMMEASNPFMHGRAIAKEAGAKDSLLATLNEIVFVLTFFTFRVVLGPYILYVTLASPDTSVFIKVASVGVQVISLVWWWKIMQILLYKVSKKGKKKAAKKE